MANSTGIELRMLRGTLGDILADKSYTIPTEKDRCCFLIAQKLVSLIGEPSQQCTDFSLWLVGESLKIPPLINSEKLWSMYTCSSAFRLKWEEFLTMAKQPNGPLLYQHVTDIMFESVVKEVVAPEEVTDENEYIGAFTFEDENAVQYVGGFVIHSLQKNKANKPIDGILHRIIVNSNNVYNVLTNQTRW